MEAPTSKVSIFNIPVETKTHVGVLSWHAGVKGNEQNRSYTVIDWRVKQWFTSVSQDVSNCEAWDTNSVPETESITLSLVSNNWMRLREV